MKQSEGLLIAERALAEVRVKEILLLEIVEALEARGVLGRSDIAGALLRMEARATIADNVDAEEGVITHHAEIASQTIDEWEMRFGLPPELYTLRTRQLEWQSAESLEKSPLDAARVIDYYSGPDD